MLQLDETLCRRRGYLTPSLNLNGAQDGTRTHLPLVDNEAIRLLHLPAQIGGMASPTELHSVRVSRA